MIDGRIYYKASEVQEFLNRRGKVLPLRMEIICIDKRIFDELIVRLCGIEKKVTRLCSPAKDAETEEMDRHPGRMRGSPHIQIHASGLPGGRSVALYPDQEQDFLQVGRCAEAVGIKCSSSKRKAMSYDLINKKDTRIDAIFESLEKMEQMIDGLQTAPRPSISR